MEPKHTHCNPLEHFPEMECCCWCGLGLPEEEANWQDEYGVPRSVWRTDPTESV